MAYPSALSYLDYQPQPDELSQLPTPPPAGAVDSFQQDLSAVPPPQLQPVPDAYTPADYAPTGLDQFAEEYAAGQGGLQLAPPRSIGQGILLGLNAALAGRGSRVARARASFQKNEEARAKAVDEQRKLATQANLTLLGNYKGAITNAMVQNAVGAEKYKRETPERTALADRQAKEDARKAAADERAQQTLERQNNIAKFQSVNQAQDNYRQDKAVLAYQQVRSNLITANAAAQQASGPGDIALIFSFMRALEPDNVNSVREGEYDNASKAVGLLNKYTQLPRRFFKGTQLSNEGRQYFLDEMGAALKARRPDYELANDQYRQGLAIVGADPKLVIRDFPPQPSLILGTPAKGKKFKKENGSDRQTSDFLDGIGY